MSLRFRATVLLVAFSTAVSVTETGAQDTDAERLTVWTGIYTAEQAARGEARFNESCTGCHGGGESGAPTLTADEEEFLQDWGEDYLVSLFDRLRGTMPARAPGSLPDGAYLDIIGFMLDENGFPAGTSELTLASLPNIRVEGRDGPGPVPDFSLVELVGCLQPSDGDWMLEQGTELARTRNPASSSPEELALLNLKASGSDTYELIYMYPTPTPFAGHRVEVKGFLIREAEPPQINVSSFASIAESCGQ